MKEEQDRTPLRTILQNFLNHIENLDNKILDGSYDKEFQELKLFSEILKSSKQYSCSEGEKEVNRKKNRYKDILPFDISRVILAGYAGVPGSDYINANFIKGASGSPAYIASQGPLPHTVNDFWRMVVECEVQVIVMACNEEEAGKHKCENYWVEREGEEKQFGMVAIRLVKASVVCPDFLVRTMQLKYLNNQSAPEERTVCQFHYSAWPDHGVPPLVRPLLDMVRLVRDTQASETLPVLVHCSAGCGRTGTICAIDYVWGLLRAGKLTKDFSLFNLVRDMRKQRIAMVQTKEQYVLVHHAVRELFCEQLRMIDSHPYENVDASGMPLLKDNDDEEEEPAYAVVRCDSSSDEKQDNKEKEAVTSQWETCAPPLPHKKRHHIASSKHEKEVENLTEKQRTILEQSSHSSLPASNSTTVIQKPKIAKLRALFERNSTCRESRNVNSKVRGSQQVTRSHSLGAVRKTIISDHSLKVQPIKSELKENGVSIGSQSTNKPEMSKTTQATVPCSPASNTSKRNVHIKRSKSLKVVGSSEERTFSLVTIDASVSPKSQINAQLPDLGLKEAVYSTCSDVRNPNTPRTSIEPRPPNISKRNVNLKSAPLSVRNNSIKQYVNINPQWSSYTCKHLSQLRRRSLESINFDEISSAEIDRCVDRVDCHRGVPCSIHNHQVNKLDQEASQIYQNCKDYLVQSEKPENFKIKHSAIDKCGRTHECDVKNGEQFQHLTMAAQRKVNTIVAGLGVRERRNSFREAVGRTKDEIPKSDSVNMKLYEPIWINKSLNKTNKSDIDKNPEISGRNQINTQKYTTPADQCNSYVDVYPGTSSLPDCSKQLYVCAHLEENNSFHNGIGPDQGSTSGITSNGNSESVSLKYPCSHSKSDFVRSRVSEKGRSQGNKKELVVSLSRSKSQQAPRVNGPISTFHDGSNTVSNIGDCNQIHGSSNRKVAKPSLLTASNSVVQFEKGSCCRSDCSDTGNKAILKSESMSCKSQETNVPNHLHSPQLCSSSNASDRPQHVTRRNEEVKPSLSKFKKGEYVNTKSFKNIPSTSSGFSAMSTTVKPDNVCQKQNSVPSDSVYREGGWSRDPRTSSRRDEMLVLNPEGQDKFSPPTKKNPENDDIISYGLIAGVQLRRGSQDDTVLNSGPSVPPRVRRHASVVLLRHSIIETSEGKPLAPLTAWNGKPYGSEQQPSRNANQKEKNEEDWSGAPGIDLDAVAASIKIPDDKGTHFQRALQALHLRKSRAAKPVSSKLCLPSETSHNGKKQQYL